MMGCRCQLALSKTIWSRTITVEDVLHLPFEDVLHVLFEAVANVHLDRCYDRDAPPIFSEAHNLYWGAQYPTRKMLLKKTIVKPDGQSDGLGQAYKSEIILQNKNSPDDFINSINWLRSLVTQKTGLAKKRYTLMPLP